MSTDHRRVAVLKEGMRLGEFKLLKELGRGAAGSVWRARPAYGDSDVALKVLHPERVGTDDERRFEREAQALCLLRCEQVVRYLGFYRSQGQTYVALEFIEGSSLRSLMDTRRSPFSPVEALQLGADIARGLAAAHAIGITHRDVKPENILLRPDGQALISDFGFARMVDTESLTRTGLSVGTPFYMAPEQVRGDRAAIGPATDIWATGVVLYELVYAMRPFDGRNPPELGRSIVQSEPALPSLGSDEAARCLHRIIEICLSKDPRRRFSSALKLAEACEASESNELPAAPGAPQKRRRLWSIVLGMALVILAAAGAALWLFLPGSKTSTNSSLSPAMLPGVLETFLRARLQGEESSLRPELERSTGAPAKLPWTKLLSRVINASGNDDVRYRRLSAAFESWDSPARARPLLQNLLRSSPSESAELPAIARAALLILSLEHPAESADDYEKIWTGRIGDSSTDLEARPKLLRLMIDWPKRRREAAPAPALAQVLRELQSSAPMELEDSSRMIFQLLQEIESDDDNPLEAWQILEATSRLLGARRRPMMSDRTVQLVYQWCQRKGFRSFDDGLYNETFQRLALGIYDDSRRRNVLPQQPFLLAGAVIFRLWDDSVKKIVPDLVDLLIAASHAGMLAETPNSGIRDECVRLNLLDARITEDPADPCLRYWRYILYAESNRPEHVRALEEDRELVLKSPLSPPFKANLQVRWLERKLNHDRVMDRETLSPWLNELASLKAQHETPDQVELLRAEIFSRLGEFNELLLALDEAMKSLDDRLKLTQSSNLAEGRSAAAPLRSCTIDGYQFLTASILGMRIMALRKLGREAETRAIADQILKLDVFARRELALEVVISDELRLGRRSEARLLLEGQRHMLNPDAARRLEALFKKKGGR